MTRDLAELASRRARTLLLAFMMTTVLVPATIANKVLFVVLMLWTASLLLRRDGPRLVPQVFVVIGIFAYGLALALPGDNRLDLAVQFFLSSFVLMLIHLIERFQLDMDAAAEACGRLIVIGTIVYWILILSPGVPFSSELIGWFNEASLSAVAQRDFVDNAATVTLALGSAPFLFVPWCLVVTRVLECRRVVDVVWLLVYGILIFLSGSRGVGTVCIMFLAFAAFLHAGPIMRVIVAVVLVMGVISVAPAVLEQTNLFSLEEESNAGKIGHFTSFVEDLDWRGAIFGNGLGSYYFSTGTNAMHAHTELTPVDMARYVGMPLTAVFFLVLLFPHSRLASYRGSHALYFIAFFLYLVLSATNPVLINSYGMLVVLWYWTKIRASAGNIGDGKRRSSP